MGDPVQSLSFNSSLDLNKKTMVPPAKQSLQYYTLDPLTKEKCENPHSEVHNVEFLPEYENKKHEKHAIFRTLENCENPQSSQR